VRLPLQVELAWVATVTRNTESERLFAILKTARVFLRTRHEIYIEPRDFRMKISSSSPPKNSNQLAGCRRVNERLIDSYLIVASLGSQV